MHHQIAYDSLMSNLAFDTHKFVKDLTANGMPDKQAEVLADHYASLLNDRLATKEDLAALRKELKGDISSLRSELKGDISDLRKDMISLEERLQSDISGLRKDMSGLEERLKGNMLSLEERLQSDMTNLEERLMTKLTIRILTAQLVGIVTICTIIGFMLTL